MGPTRRELLLAAGGAAFLAACGGSDDDEQTFQLVKRWPDTPLFVPGEVRLAVSLTDGSTLLTDGPDELKGSIVDNDGAKITDVVSRRRDQGMTPPYWDVRAELPAAGIYTLLLGSGDASFQVFDPSEVVTPLTGSPMPGFDTPTVDDHRGVEPYCSLTPAPCPLHDVTLTDALASGKPVVYVVGTPAHCATGVCAPGLELVVAEHDRLGDQVVMVHADVYADDAASEVAPAVSALEVEYEPIVYLCDDAGVIVDRLDGVWDGSELRERLDALLA